MQDKIFEVIVPTEEEIEIKEGKRRKIQKRVFPGYILIEMIMDEEECVSREHKNVYYNQKYIEPPRSEKVQQNLEVFSLILQVNLLIRCSLPMVSDEPLSRLSLISELVLQSLV